MKTPQYFLATRSRPDREYIKDVWIQHALSSPAKVVVQQDGRVRRWALIAEAESKWLRVVTLEDGKTVHNAFFDRSFTL